MTRSAAKPDSPRPTGAPPARLAALHRQGSDCRLVIARAGSESVEVLAARSVKQGDSATLAALIREHRVQRLLHVLPASATVCRSVQLPDSGAPESPEAIAKALALLAEAELPVSIPAHRRAGGLIRPGPDTAKPIALLVGWPAAAATPDSSAEFDVDDESYVPEPVALAALAGAPGPVGTGGADTAVCADMATGSIAVLASTAGRSMARILRADNSSPAGWSGALATAITETRAAVGLPPLPAGLPPSRDGRTLLLAGSTTPEPAASGQHISGVPSEPGWRDSYGLALGAIIAAVADPTLTPLTLLHPDPPGRSGSPVIHAITWLSHSRRAVIALAACVAIVLFWPLGVAAARNWVLHARAGGASPLSQRLDAADKQAAFYEILRDRRWPMTKLLADIASAAPVGVVVESVELSPEQGAGSGLSLKASADSRDQVAMFVKNLTDTRVFADVRQPLTTEGASGGGASVDFRVEARVAGPLLKGSPIEDFARKPLAERLYGAGATNTFSSARSDREPQGDNSRNGRNQPRRSNGGGRNTTAPSAAAAETKPGEIPAPIADDDIAKLDHAAALKEFTTRGRFANTAGLEEATKQRLRDEAGKCKQRMLATTNEKPA